MFLDAALSFARRGIAIFPIAPMSKLPAINRARGGKGCLDATTNADQIRKWWRENSRYNIGVATGELSKIWVLDIDTKSDGFTALRALEDQYGKLPDTRIASTPTGGVHYYWRWNPDWPVRNSTSKFANGIDTRGLGGYVVAPPSEREEGAYVWISDTPAAYAPQWLHSLCITRMSEPVMRNSPSNIKPPTNEDAMKLLDRLGSWRADNYDAWTAVGMALRELGDEGLRLWDSWSRKSNKYVSGECEQKWNSFEPEGIRYGSLVYWANEDSPRPAKAERQGRRVMTADDYGSIIANGSF